MTPKAALIDLAANFNRWRSKALGRAADKRKQGDEAEAHFHEGRAHAFDDAAMAASRCADAFEDASAPSDIKREFWEALNVGLNGSLDLTITCVAGEEWKICFIGDRVIAGEGNTFAEAWANRSVDTDPAPAEGRY